MAESDQEKTEAPTPRRRQDARRDGNVAKSQDLTAAIMLLAAMVLLYMLGMQMFEAMGRSMASVLRMEHAANPTRPDDILAMLSMLAVNMAVGVLPFLVIVTMIGIVAVLMQVGLMLTLKPLKPSLGRMNPIKGAKNLANTRALMRFVQSVFKLVLISGVATLVLILELPRIVHMSDLSVGQGLIAGSQVVFSMGIKLAALLLILAIIDYVYQKWQHTQDLKMTKQDVRDEMKRMEGDPQIKQRRARVARQLAMQRMAQAVPGADVIVTNPTHFSVALKYDSSSMRAPKVVAKGADLMAMRIRQIAAANDIPIVERKPLARALFATCEVGDEVPAEHYTAVAEILAYVYRLAQAA